MVNKLYLSITGSASLDMRESGTITAIEISTQSPTAVTNQIEVGFNSAAQFQTNDATGVLASVNVPSVIAASVNVVIPLSEAVDAGERLYLHQSAGGMTSVVIYSIPGGPPSTRLPARRR